MEVRNLNNNNESEGRGQKRKTPALSSKLNNNSISRLDDLAFKAFLRARKDMNFVTTDYDAVIDQYIQKQISLFLQYIADANLKNAEELLKENPELAVLACGTVTTTTSSGNTYENITAIQLAYVLDDVEMGHMMLSYIKNLPKEMRKKSR